MPLKNPVLNRYVDGLAPGKLEWIGLRPAHKAEMLEVAQVNALAGLGLDGDHRAEKTPGSARQVTLISAEHIEVIAQLLGKDMVLPMQLRRNLVIRGINPSVLRYKRFRIGTAEFEATAQCHPCKRMEDALGKGGFAAMYGHGGLCAKVLTSGQICLGDAVTLLT